MASRRAKRRPKDSSVTARFSQYLNSAAFAEVPPAPMKGGYYFPPVLITEDQRRIRRSNPPEASNDVATRIGTRKYTSRQLRPYSTKDSEFEALREQYRSQRASGYDMVQYATQMLEDSRTERKALKQLMQNTDVDTSISHELECVMQRQRMFVSSLQCSERSEFYCENCRKYFLSYLAYIRHCIPCRTIPENMIPRLVELVPDSVTKLLRVCPQLIPKFASDAPQIVKLLAQEPKAEPEQIIIEDESIANYEPDANAISCICELDKSDERYVLLGLNRRGRRPDPDSCIIKCLTCSRGLHRKCILFTKGRIAKEFVCPFCQLNHDKKRKIPHVPKKRRKEHTLLSQQKSKKNRVFQDLSDNEIITSSETDTESINLENITPESLDFSVGWDKTHWDQDFGDDEDDEQSPSETEVEYVINNNEDTSRKFPPRFLAHVSRSLAAALAEAKIHAQVHRTEKVKTNVSQKPPGNCEMPPSTGVDYLNEFATDFDKVESELQNSSSKGNLIKHQRKDSIISQNEYLACRRISWADDSDNMDIGIVADRTPGEEFLDRKMNLRLFKNALFSCSRQPLTAALSTTKEYSDSLLDSI